MSHADVLTQQSHAPLTAAYRYPLERGNDRKLHEEIYSVAIT